MKLSKSETVETPIASLIDIVFLLIIFFVVTSEIDKDAVDESIRLAETQFIDPITKNDPRTITINMRRVGDNKSLLKIANVPLSLPELSSILKQTLAVHGNTVPVVIRADSDIKFHQINHVIESVTDVGLFRIKLASKDLGH